VVVLLDEHGVGLDRLREGDDGAIAFVVVTLVAELARSRSISPSSSGMRSNATSAAEGGGGGDQVGW